MSASQNPEVRLRFAPSPTGYLHVGGARTALYNYLYAKKMNGKFILRIEDTDQARSTEEALRMQISDLKWLGLDWDEGPDAETLKDIGSYGPYRQSHRLSIYKKVADQLIDSGKAYYCFMTDAELDLQREKFKGQGKPQHIESPYANWPKEKALEKLKSGTTAVVRFKTGNLKKDFKFNDIVRGEITFPSDMVGDFVLLRSDGMPVYNFCCVVDDYMMKISHVLRAEEHLPNTLRQMMIYEGMEWKMPLFGHLSIILDEDKQKLSKRKGATSCNEFKNEGYLPQALKNFIALLGWSHPQEKEILSEKEMIEAFSLDRFIPSGAVFDAVKLKWMNATHLRALSDSEIYALLKPFFAREGFEFPNDPVWQNKSVEVFRSYMETLLDTMQLYRPLSDKSFAILPEAAEVYGWDSTKKVLETWKDLISKHTSEYLTEAEFLKYQDQVKDLTGAKGKFLFQAIRVAVIGKPQGTELKILVPLIKISSLVHRAELSLKDAK